MGPKLLFVNLSEWIHFSAAYGLNAACPAPGSLWEASDDELGAVLGRQTEPRCGTELQEPFKDIWRSACCSWVRVKGCISDRAYILPQPSNHFPNKSVPESQLLVLGNYLPLACSLNGTPKNTIYSININQALDINPEIFHWTGSCLALTQHQ